MALGLKGVFLVDTRASTLEPVNDTVFTVDTNAVRLEANGLVDSDIAVVQILVGPNEDDVLWTDLYLAGQKVQLDATHTQAIIMLGGKYRVHYAGSAEVVVYAEWDRMELDKNVFYNYQQPNPISGGGGSGFTLTAVDSNSIDLTYDGDTSAGSLIADLIVSPDADNTIERRANGVYAASERLLLPWTAETSDFAVSSTNHTYTINAASESTVTATLPFANANANSIYFILAQGLGTVNLATSGSDTINGNPSPLTILTGSCVFLCSDTNSNWLTVIGGVP